MQRGESHASGDRETSVHDVAAVDPMTGAIVDAAPPLTVPEQLRLLEIRKHGAGTPLDEVVQRLRARADLLGIPAMTEEIIAEAKRRTSKTAEPPAASEPESAQADRSDDGGVFVDEPWPFERGSTVVVQIRGHQVRGTFLSFEADGPLGGSCGVDITESNVNWGIPCGMAWVALDQVSAPEPVDESPIEPKPDDQADPLAPAAEQLAALRIGASCTAEMSLSMIRGRVAREALLISPVPSQDEITAEAERIWRTFDANRAGPREYDVVNGEVHDWRRPDTTPDRGDVTTVHTITDETAQQRFSGGGADDAQQQSLFLVPTDAAFNGRQYRDAPELANIAEKLIGEHGFLQQLENCDVRWYWKRKTGVSKGRVKIGFMKRASDLLGHFSGADFIGWLSATTARDGKFTDRQVEAAVFHQLCHIGSDDSGNWIFAPHDFEGFAAEVRVFGTWTSDLKLGGNAFVAAHQMGLFTEEEADDDEEDEPAFSGPSHAPMRDGAGTLIHADGTALTDDEIEAMERHELNDDPADPDAEYDDDPMGNPPPDRHDPFAGDDPLADHDL
jgi:hypothetical protein